MGWLFLFRCVSFDHFATNHGQSQLPIVIPKVIRVFDTWVRAWGGAIPIFLNCYLARLGIYFWTSSGVANHADSSHAWSPKDRKTWDLFSQSRAGYGNTECIPSFELSHCCAFTIVLMSYIRPSVSFDCYF